MKPDTGSLSRVMLVGSDHVWSLERIFLKYLEQEGLSVELFAAQNLFYEYNSRSLVNKLLLRAGVSGIYRSINQQLRSRIERSGTELVWVFKGMEVLPETLEWMRSRGIRSVNFNPDNPFIFSGRGSGNKYVTDSIGSYDLHFTYNLEVKRRLEEEFHAEVDFLPFGFELSEDIFQSACRETEIGGICFLGNPDKERAAVIKSLTQEGLPVDLFGNDWAKFVDAHPLQRIFPAVYGDEFWKILRRYRVQLNLMRRHNEHSHNMRSFEVPGVGGIMLAPATPEHKMFFKDGEEAFLFTDLKSCVQKARYLLGLDQADADGIRRRARQRSIQDGYSYQHRAKTVVKQLRTLYAKARDHSF